MVQLHVSEDRVRRFMARCAEDFGDWCRYVEAVYRDLLADGRVSSVSSMITVLGDVAVFLRWLRGKGVDPERMGEDVVREFLIELRGRCRDSTVYTYVRSLRRAFRVWGRGDLIRVLKYPRVRITYRLPSPELIEDVIGEVNNLMYKTILALLYETGMRLSECLSLTVNDVERSDEGYFKIRVMDAKNGESRKVFVIKYAGLLREYINAYRPKHYLFPSPSRPGKPIHPNNVEKLLRRLGRRRGVRLHPHIIRHVTATKLIEEGMPERVVMKLLGHKSERMMRVYVNLTAKDVEEALLRKYGIRKDVRGEESIECPKCGASNPAGARYCWRCGLPLSLASAAEREAALREVEEVLRRLKELFSNRPELLKFLLP